MAPGAGKEPMAWDALQAQAQAYGVAVLAVVPPQALDADLVADLDVDWARSHCLLPIRLEGEACVLTADPQQISEVESLSLLIGEALRPVLAPRDEVERCIEACYFSREASPQTFLETLSPVQDVVPTRQRGDDLLSGVPEAPVVQFVNLLLLEAVKRAASDIHFEPLESGLRVRYRIDGRLYEQSSPPRHLEEALVARLKVMANMDIAEKRLPQDGMARVRVGEREIDVRASTVPVPDGERVVLRLLDKQNTVLDLEKLGMADRTLVEFRGLLSQPSGIVLVCGPTGSGKTSTLYAALNELDSAHRNILTIEDPIEYKMPNIGQIQVKPRIGLTFASGLRHILRQDPDVILVGEIRDLETAEIAIRAALTGHLVFATLHTNDAAGSVLRLLDMGVEPYLLGSCLRGALSQRLVRVLCPACRREASISGGDMRTLHGDAAGAGRDGSCWEPVGCDACLEGYRGRMGIFELMVADREITELVHSGKATTERLAAAAGRHGMQSLRDDGLRKIASGVTSVAEVLEALASA